MNIKIYCYNSLGVIKGTIENIKNLDSLQFNELVNGGQGNFDIELNEKHDNFNYTVGDFIEYVIFNEKYKNGIHKYTGVIKGIEREIGITESITLKVEGLVSLLSDYKITKTYAGTLKNVIDTLISDFHQSINISNNMLYLGNSILKNGVSNTDLINIYTDGTFLNALEKIFGEKEFFINQTGNIIFIDEITTEQILTVGLDISKVNIDITGKISIDLFNYDYNIQVGQNIILQNINSNLNLSGKRIKELAFGLYNLKINAGKILKY